jgi:hypothetical protein
MTAGTDTDSTSVGAPVTLTVEVDGTGNLATLAPPSVGSPGDMEVYEPTVETNIERNASRIHGTKTFTYTLVPQSGGRYDLPAVTFSYFDPDAGRYRTRRAQPSTLRGHGGGGPAGGGPDGKRPASGGRGGADGGDRGAVGTNGPASPLPKSLGIPRPPGAGPGRRGRRRLSALAVRWCAVAGRNGRRRENARPQ